MGKCSNKHRSKQGRQSRREEEAEKSALWGKFQASARPCGGFWSINHPLEFISTEIRELVFLNLG
jgi:hypothetical protein